MESLLNAHTPIDLFINAIWLHDFKKKARDVTLVQFKKKIGMNNFAKLSK